MAVSVVEPREHTAVPRSLNAPRPAPSANWLRVATPLVWPTRLARRVTVVALPDCGSGARGPSIISPTPVGRLLLSPIVTPPLQVSALNFGQFTERQGED